MTAIHAGCSEVQILGMVVDGINRATASRAASASDDVVRVRVPNGAGPDDR